METDLNALVDTQVTRLSKMGLLLAGVDRASLTALVEEELFGILQPTISIKGAIRQHFGDAQDISFDSCRYLEAVIDRRMEMMGGFLLAATEALGLYRSKVGTEIGYSSECQPAKPFHFRTLSGDSHNGGTRPLAIKEESGAVVLKFADPRPYQVTAEILAALSRGIGVNLVPPPIFPDRNNRWYFIEYLDEDPSGHDGIEEFMFAMGAMTAVAFCLRFVDLHLENLIVANCKPIIIDPECIFYNFDGDITSERLLNTGLLSHSVYLSSLRGGEAPGVPLFDFDLHLGEDGILRYRKPARIHRNRVRKHDGSMADPSHYRTEVIGGYVAAYRWFTSSTDEVCDIIQTRVTDDFRVRFLARKTRHYASVTHMLNLPNIDNYPMWVEEVFERFRASGHFPESMSPTLVAAELRDLENRDIPYFWVNAGEKAIQHRTSSVQPLETKLTVKAQAIQDIRSLHEQDLDAQLKILEAFLDIDLTQPQREMASD
ncbi:MAG: DUF4135 domain-containing protein [Gammaproteobacteria bacterium]|nr:DUF4135 domain-containing protein [Gammaproteobacteria bacterium]